MRIIADNEYMKVTGGEYLTVQEMSGILGESTNTITKRLFRLGIKPIAKDALYPISALDAIKNTVMGRPKTAPENAADKTGKKKPATNGKPKKPRNKKV